MDALKLPDKYVYKLEESMFEDTYTFRIKDVFTEDHVNVRFSAYLFKNCQ